jgi:membrane-bound acyltransferase YfiQ involved in biofilm formation
MCRMSVYDIIAWVVLIVLVAALVIIALKLAALPGKIARNRQHPWSEAVNIAGWLSFFLGFAFWPLALIWAYVDTPVPAERRTKP